MEISSDRNTLNPKLFRDEMTYLSVVIPTYNEASAIRAGKLNRVSAWLATQPFASELIVVDDGSRDETAEVAIGSHGLVRRGAPLGRYILSWGQIALRSALLGRRITDTQCGFKAARRASACGVMPLEGVRRWKSEMLKKLRSCSISWTAKLN